MNSECSHGKKKCSLLGRKVMINLDSIILKSRDITLPTKVSTVKATVFPIVMYGCETWTIKKTENWKYDAFKLWGWRKLLWVPWTARRSNRSILKEISPEYSLEGLMLKLKLQYSFEKTLMLEGGEWDNRGWDGWMALSTQHTWVWANSGRQWRTGKPGMLCNSPWGCKELDKTEVT